MRSDDISEVVKYLKASIILQLANRDNGGSAVKVEYLLSQAGLTIKEIAQLLGRKESTVGVAIHRSKLQAKKGL